MRGGGERGNSWACRRRHHCRRENDTPRRRKGQGAPAWDDVCRQPSSGAASGTAGLGEEAERPLTVASFFFSIPVHISAWPPPLLRIFPPARLPGSDLVLGVGGAGEGMMAACSHGRLMGRRRRRGWCLAGIELVAAARATTVRTATVTVTTACITFSPLTTTPRRRRSPRRASQTTGTAATAAAAAAATTTPARSPTVAMVASEVATATAAAVTATATTTAMVGCASVDEGRRPPPQGRRCYDTGEGECHDGGGHDGFRVGGEGKVAVVGSASWAG